MAVVKESEFRGLFALFRRTARNGRTDRQEDRRTARNGQTDRQEERNRIPFGTG